MDRKTIEEIFKSLGLDETPYIEVKSIFTRGDREETKVVTTTKVMLADLIAAISNLLNK